MIEQIDPVVWNFSQFSHLIKANSQLSERPLILTGKLIYTLEISP